MLREKFPHKILIFFSFSTFFCADVSIITLAPSPLGFPPLQSPLPSLYYLLVVYLCKSIKLNFIYSVDGCVFVCLEENKSMKVNLYIPLTVVTCELYSTNNRELYVKFYILGVICMCPKLKGHNVKFSPL